MIGRRLQFDFRGVPREFPHYGHTAEVTAEVDLGDGTSDLTWTCECGGSWTVAVGVDDSDEAESQG